MSYEQEHPISPNTIQVSVVVPVYNSAKTLAELCSRVDAAMKQAELTYEIICVEDGSVDSSWEQLESIYREGNFPLRALRLDGNFGQHKALMAGIAVCRGTCCVTLDDDLQVPPEAIVLLVNRQKETGAELVYGLFSEKKHNQMRRWGSSLQSQISRHFGSTPGWGSSFKLIDGEVARKIARFPYQSVYLDEVLGWHCAGVTSVDVPHHPRKEGETGYTPIRLIVFTIGILFLYTTFPLRLMVWGGILASLLSFLLGCYFIYLKIDQGVPPGFTGIIVTIFFATGLLLSSMGVLGEYLRRIYLSQLGKPSWRIRQTLS
jgi:polyisoprenyl-phosphate glycosyltransferase